MTANFSDIYLRPSALQEDSRRMRVQLGAAYEKIMPANNRWESKKHIEQHSGINAQSSRQYAPLDLHFGEGHN